MQASREKKTPIQVTKKKNEVFIDAGNLFNI